MSYTYDDFVAAANSAGIMNQFSQGDIAAAQHNPEYGMTMLGLLTDISKATTEEQRLLATEAANQMRKNYGVYDTESVAAKQNGTLGQGTVVNDIKNQENGYGSFSYDLQSDPNWSAYKKAYMREGERASANALAQVAAATGGIPSSYAVTAAQQAGNYYAGQLADIIPTLQQNAYNQYLAEYERALASYQSLGYATPEVAAILGFSKDNSASINTNIGSNGGNLGGNGGNGWNNGKLTAEQVIELQKILGVTADGKYGPASSAAAGGLSADEAYKKYVQTTTIDMNSVLQLGYGPINEDRLAELVALGEIEMYQEGNLIRFRKVEKQPTIISPTWRFTQDFIKNSNKGKETVDENSGSETGDLKPGIIAKI